MVEVLKSVPEEKHLANEITSSLKDPIVHEFGWLACWDDDIEIWYPAFVVLYDYTHMRLYEGPRRAIGREIETIDLTFTDSNIPAVVTPDHKKMTTSWSHNIFGITNTAKVNIYTNIHTHIYNSLHHFIHTRVNTCPHII